VGKYIGDWQGSGGMCTVKASRFGLLTGRSQRDINKKIGCWWWRGVRHVALMGETKRAKFSTENM
jgi:hypothetical protein